MDIVARDGQTVVFVEVKTREGCEFGAGAEAVTWFKRRRMASVAQDYLARHRLVDEVIHGTVTWEWLEGERFLIQRSRTDDERFPDGMFVIGPPEDGDGLVAEYFDSRGVRRTYAVSLEGGVLRMSRDAPGFDQRYVGTLGEESFDGAWQVAETPGEWRDDLKVTYRRRR